MIYLRYRPMWYIKFLVWFTNIDKFKTVRIESAKRKSYPYKGVDSFLYVNLGIKR